MIDNGERRVATFGEGELLRGVFAWERDAIAVRRIASAKLNEDAVISRPNPADLVAGDRKAAVVALSMHFAGGCAFRCHCTFWDNIMWAIQGDKTPKLVIEAPGNAQECSN